MKCYVHGRNISHLLGKCMPGYTQKIIKQLPALFSSRYDNKMVSLQIFDGEITEDFISDGWRYHPVYAVQQRQVDEHWIKWCYDANGKDIKLQLAEAIPPAVQQLANKKIMYFDYASFIRINPRTLCNSGKSSLVINEMQGKYVNTFFLDEMSRQVSRQLKEMLSLKKLNTGEWDICANMDIDTAGRFDYKEYGYAHTTIYSRVYETSVVKGSGLLNCYIRWKSVNPNKKQYTQWDYVTGDDVFFELCEQVDDEVLTIHCDNLNKYQDGCIKTFLAPLKPLSWKQKLLEAFNVSTYPR